MSSVPDFYDLFKKHEPRVNGASVTPLDPARATRYAAKAVTSECENVASAAEGTRNHTLNKAAFSIGQLVAAGHVERDEAWAALADAARACGLPETEAHTTIRSGLAAGAETPRVVPDLPEAPAVTVLDLEMDEEERFWKSRQILTHLRDFARARIVSPWAVLGVALARIITATPPQVCLPPTVGGKASLNMFVGLVGTSGSGKGAAESVAADAIHLGYLTSHNVGSGEGIAHGYMHRVKGNLEWNDDTHAVLFSVPEIDSLAAQGDRRGATLMPQLRSGWTGEQLGFGYADPTKRIVVPAHEYRLCLVAGIQPARAGCLLDDADGGTPQRFLWMPATDPGAPDYAPLEPAPLVWEPPPLSGLATVGGIKVQICETARQVIIENRRARVRGDGEALDGHALLCQLKTAAALGIAEGRYSVNDEDWALAGVIMRKSAAVRAEVQRALRAKFEAANYGRAEAEAERALHVADKVADAAIKRVCRTITRRLAKETDGATRSALRRAVASADRAHFEAALERLSEAGQIVTEEGAKGDHYTLADK